MTKKLVYMEFKNVTEKELQEMMDNKFNTLTQRGLDRELESLTGIPHRTWGNYKLDTQLGKGVSQQLKINELTNKNNEMREILKMVMTGDYTCGDIICDIEDFLSREEKYSLKRGY